MPDFTSGKEFDIISEERKKKNFISLQAFSI
jgi:hypothetical protein